MTKPLGRRKRTNGLIALKDLVPRKDPKGGAAGKTVFGDLSPLAGPAPEPRAREPAHAKPKRPKK